MLLVDHNHDALEALRTTLQKVDSESQVEFFNLDITNQLECHRIFNDHTINPLGKIDGVIRCAAVTKIGELNFKTWSYRP